MKKKIILLIIASIQVFNISTAQYLLSYKTGSSAIATENPVKKPTIFEFKAYSNDSQLENISKEMAGNHQFGDLIAKKLYLLEKNYTSEAQLTPGNPQTITVIKKPVIYEAVKHIERDLKRAVRKGDISVESASNDLNKVLDVALNIRTADTNSFENALESAGNTNSKMELFTKRVNLKYY